MVEWSALFNCLRMRFVKIGTDNEMPGRIKLSQAGRDNLPFRAGICGEIRGKYVVAISGPWEASSARSAIGRGLLPGDPPVDDGACEKNNEKDYREAHRRAVLRFPQASGAPSPPVQRSPCAAPRVRAHREILFSLVSSSPGWWRMGSTLPATLARGRRRYVLPGPA